MIAGRGDVKYNFNAGQGAELSILHAGHFSQADLNEVGRLVKKGVIKVRPLIKDIVSIDDAVKYYDMLRDTPGKLLGTIFMWDK